MRNNWELRKRGYLIRFGHTEALLWKKRTLNGHFSRPAQTDPNEHQYALCMIWDWLVCTAFKLLYKDLELNYPKTWFCIIWWLSNKMNITISLCLLEDFFFSQPLPLDLCGPHLSFSLLDTNTEMLGIKGIIFPMVIFQGLRTLNSGVICWKSYLHHQRGVYITS